MGTQITHWFIPYSVTPSRLTSPATFSSDRDIRLSEEDSVLDEYNNFGLQLNAIGEEVEVNAETAETKAQEASDSALIALGSANFQGDWTTLTAYTVGQSVYYSSAFYVCRIANSDATFTEANWLVNVPLGAVGNINNPLLDLPLNNSLAFKQGVGEVTFTRTTTATYIDRYGVLQTAAINKERFEKDGLLMEGGSTNIITYSESFTDVSWSKTGLAPVDDALSIAGLTMCELTESVLDEDHRIAKSESCLADTTYTMQIKIKAGTRRYGRLRAADDIGFISSANIDLISGTINGSTEGVKKLKDGVFIFSHTFTTNTGATTFSLSGLYIWDTETGGSTSGDRYLGDGSISAHVDQFQIEALSFSTSYIFTTTTSATRGQDNLDVSFAGNFPDDLSDCSVSIDVQLIGSNTTFPKVVETGSWAMLVGGAAIGENSSYIYKGTESSTPEIAITNDKFRFLGTYSEENTSLKMFHNGVLVGEDLDATNSNANIDNIGLSYPNTFYHISNFRVWGETLTPTEAALC